MPPRESVFIVEDDNDLGNLYRATLMRAGFQVAFVQDGVDALRYLDQNIPDLIILDLDPPMEQWQRCGTKFDRTPGCVTYRSLL